MKRKRLLKRISEGQLKNVAFGDMINMVEGFGFRLDRVSGSHHIFAHEAIPELVNLQEVKGRLSHIRFGNFCDWSSAIT